MAWASVAAGNKVSPRAASEPVTPTAIVETSPITESPKKRYSTLPFMKPGFARQKVRRQRQRRQQQQRIRQMNRQDDEAARRLVMDDIAELHQQRAEKCFIEQQQGRGDGEEAGEMTAAGSAEMSRSTAREW